MCPNSHGLTKYNCDLTDLLCDLCNQVLPMDSIMRGCLDCDYYACDVCYHPVSHDEWAGEDAMVDQISLASSSDQADHGMVAATKRPLDVEATEWLLTVGEVAFLPEAVGFGAYMVPSHQISAFRSGDPQVVTCTLENVTPEGWCGGAQYEHHLTPMSVGSTTVSSGGRTYKVQVEAAPVRHLTGYNDETPRVGMGRQCHGYVILGPHAAWRTQPTMMTILGQTVPVAREYYYNLKARGLNLQNGSFPATVALSDGSVENVQVNVSTVC